MIKIFVLLILWALPWRLQSWGDVAEIQVAIGCEAHPDLDGICAAYYDPNHGPATIRLCEHECLQDGVMNLSTLVLHESQHHMQLQYHAYDWPVGYTAFRQAVLREIMGVGYNEELRYAVYRLIEIDQANDSPYYSELHAQLPCLLDMQIPPDLRYWYPWFVLE